MVLLYSGVSAGLVYMLKDFVLVRYIDTTLLMIQPRQICGCGLARVVLQQCDSPCPLSAVLPDNKLSLELVID